MSILIKRISLLFLFVIIVALAKFFIIWDLSIERQWTIFFDYSPVTNHWYSFFYPFLIYLTQVTILIIGGIITYILFKVFIETALPSLDGYELPFFIFLPLIAFSLLNSTYFIYNYVGVHSSIDYEGMHGSPETKEFPYMVLPKENKLEIENKITALENNDQTEGEVATRRFLFLGTAAINGYQPIDKNLNGAIDYLVSLLETFVEYIIVMLLYLFMPLFIHEIFIYKKASYPHPENS